jgi:hypothetical protein
MNDTNKENSLDFRLRFIERWCCAAGLNSACSKLLNRRSILKFTFISYAWRYLGETNRVNKRTLELNTLIKSCTTEVGSHGEIKGNIYTHQTLDLDTSSLGCSGNRDVRGVMVIGGTGVWHYAQHSIFAEFENIVSCERVWLRFRKRWSSCFFSGARASFYSFSAWEPTGWSGGYLGWFGNPSDMFLM